MILNIIHWNFSLSLLYNYFMSKSKILILLFCFLTSYTYASKYETIKTTQFGKVQLFMPQPAIQSFIFFISGDGGWDRGMSKIAQAVSERGAIVVGIDYPTYAKMLRKQKNKCYYPSGDFESFSMAFQKKLKLHKYFKPIIIGYSSGATMAYGALAQAPANTFKGVIALGFAPDIDLSKTFCNGTGLTSHVLKEGKSYYFEPSKKLTAPFIVLQGIRDQTCTIETVQKYIKEVRNGELMILPNMAHDFKDLTKWMTQFDAAYHKIQTAPSFAEERSLQNKNLIGQHLVALPGDFPITIVPSSTKSASSPMAFIISGDGGWTSFDQLVAEELAEKGISVVGLDAQKYFWEEKTPEETTLDITKAVVHYMQQWNKQSFILVGYSFGACVVPFIANRFSPALKSALHSVFSISPDERADFEIHISDMLSLGTSDNHYNVLTEIDKMKNIPLFCFFGDEEDAQTRIRFMQNKIKVITLKGDHGYDGNAGNLANEVVKRLN